MSSDIQRTSAVDQLLTIGRPSVDQDWIRGELDYVAKYSLTSEHIPELISLATSYIDEPSDNVAVYGPVHAWRALGQLRAVEAVQPLLDTQSRFDEIGDDWYLEEYRYVFRLIGPPAIELLARYLADDSQREFPRSNAASGLREIARDFPETRDQVVGILCAELARNQPNSYEFYGFLIYDLVEMHAVEAVDVIERAFAADVVETAICDWEYVREKLGVTGTGIVPERKVRSPYFLWQKPRGIYSASPTQEDKRRAKAKRKQQRKSRNRNRR